MRISDWSSDVCSSDLVARRPAAPPAGGLGRPFHRHHEWRDHPLLDNISLAADAATLSPVALFVQADWIVRIVMIGLLLASIYVWAVIFTPGRGPGQMLHASEQIGRACCRARGCQIV